jgi:hypothetical protein
MEKRKQGRPKKYHGELTPTQRARASYLNAIKDKKKFNTLIDHEVYDRFMRLEKSSGHKFHSDFIMELLEVYESTEELRKVLRK